MSCNRCHQFIVTLLLLVGVMAAPSSLHAQSQPTNDQNLITRLDCRRTFPTCALTLFDPALPNNVDKENVALSTNRGDLTTLAVERPRQPMRVLFVFDGPQPVRQAGGAGRFKDAVIDLLSWYTSNSNPELLNENQWAAAMIARDAPDDLVSLVDWQQGNYGGFMNVITSNMESLPNGGPPTSAFFEPVQKAVNLFPDGNITNILILFSDGFEIQSSGASANLIQAALKKNVHVYTVLHFAGGGSRAASDMQALAAATGGQFIENAERAQLATLWQALTNEQQPLVATFTMPTNNPTKLTVNLELPSNRRLTETTDFPAIDVPPLRIAGVSVNGQN
ncbi:MAG: VWA domain-containing protein, partial [Caldilineaceae bacterium]|nr:VWA domain-containing protein [Caldilineaceae bacterium]